MAPIPRPLQEVTHDRSGSMCEAMVKVAGGWARCWRAPVETHHKLPRGRGGSLLDAVGETRHLIDLCNRHHIQAESQRDDAYTAGLLIRGFIDSAPDGHPVYTGPDPTLSALYPKEPRP